MNLAKKLESISQDIKPEDIQTLVYSTGKENGYEEKLREWFILIYEVLFGSEDGPRMGFFISFFGVKETIKLINAGKYNEAAIEFLNNKEYKDAKKRNRRGIRKNMEKVSSLLRKEGTI